MKEKGRMDELLLNDLTVTEWSDAIQHRFYPVRVIPIHPTFIARMHSWSFDNTLITYSHSSPARYVRSRADETFRPGFVNLTLFVDATVTSYDGLTRRTCYPGPFVVQAADNYLDWEQETSGEM
jgi:hypothetical protein